MSPALSPSCIQTYTSASFFRKGHVQISCLSITLTSSCIPNHIVQCKWWRSFMAGKVDLKVVLLGKEYGGKTSLVERYIHGKFNSNAPYQSVSSKLASLFGWGQAVAVNWMRCIAKAAGRQSCGGWAVQWSGHCNVCCQPLVHE